MSTVVVVRKEGRVALAADTLRSCGSLGQTARFRRRPDKILGVGEDCYVGLVGASVHHRVLARALAQSELAERRDEDAIFDFLVQLHPRLKDEYFLRPHDEDDDPYESSRIHLLLINRGGAFGVSDLRNVTEYPRFWAIGSGQDFALGALHATYERDEPATELARAAVRAACEFDRGSAEPVTAVSVALVA